jgi:hypothetical protein
MSQSIRTQRCLPLALLLALLSWSATRASAQICFPPAVMVPASPTAAPDWWSAGASLVGSQTTSFLDDPRWNGALSQNVLEYERFRVVVQTDAGVQYLVMSWEVRADMNSAGDRLYFGLWDDASNSGNVYRLTRSASAQTPTAGAQGAAAFSGKVFAGAGAPGSVAWTGSHTVPPPPLPAWLTTDARVDVTCATPPTTQCDRWAFRIRAPLSAAANPADVAPTGLKLSGPNFHFWYEIQDSASVGSAAYAYPAGLVNASESAGIPPLVLPDPITWKAAKLGSGAGCESDVSLAASGVWVNSSGSTQLDFSSNTFHAQPVNNTGHILHNDQISARFRIANWGSVLGTSPEWRETCSSSAVPGNVAAASAFDLHCTWSGFDACPYKPVSSGCGPQAGTKNRHQCVLVDLANTSGSLDSLVFAPTSLFRNMDFDVNSVLTREALVDTRGLPAMANGALLRDLFLYIQTRNLPARTPGSPLTSETSAQPTAAAPGALAVAPGNPPGDAVRIRQISALRARFQDLALPSEGPIGTQSSQRIQSALVAGKLTLDQVELLMPTYIVYVWHDTGKTINTDNGPVKVLEPQPSFGLFLAHDGALDGWDHRFEGAQLISENLYKITSLRDQVVHVTATIAPKGELPPPTPTPRLSCGRCDVAAPGSDSRLALVLTLAFVGIVAGRLRRRRGVS